MNDKLSFVGGDIFREIKIDPRVTPDLDHCIYCAVSHYDNNSTKNIQYQIPLDCINGSEFKQCPACKIIYILGDPTNGVRRDPMSGVQLQNDQS